MICSDILSYIELLNKTLRTLIDKHAPKPALILGIIMIFTKPSYIEGLEREWKVKKCLSSRSDCLFQGKVPESIKEAIVIPLLKKQSLDLDVLSHTC